MSCDIMLTLYTWGILALLAYDFEHFVRPINTVSFAPSRGPKFVPAVVEPVLGFRRAVQINDDLDPRFPGPLDGFVEIFGRSKSVWFANIDIRPIPNRNSYDVEARIHEFLKIGKAHKAVPVGVEYAPATVLAEVFTQRPLIVDSEVLGAMLPENGRCDEPGPCSAICRLYNSIANDDLRFKDEPAANVGSLDFGGGPIEVHPPLF